MRISGFLSFVGLTLAIGSADAAPSGGPYGPLDRDYAVPDAAHVYYVAPDGDANAAGTSLDAPTSIESAIARVVSGDAIVLRGGVYRTGNLLLNQGVTIQPYGSERPVFKGTKVATEWEALRGNVWRTRWEQLFPATPLAWWRRNREGMITPLHRFNNDMVFLDGEFLQSAGWEGELDAHSYFIDYDNGWVYIGTDPAGKLVEITAHDAAIIRTSQRVHGKRNDRKGPTIRGITFTQYAYRCLEVEGKKQFTSSDEPTDDPVGPADPDTFGKEAVGTVLENLTISYCSRVAGYFRGDGLVIRNTLVENTGTEGIYVIGSSDVLIERNIVRRNNIEHLTGYYASAVKIFNQTHRVTFRDNLVVDHPDSNGVWYDVGNRDGVVVDNHIEGTQVGFMFEISQGATVAGNVFVRNGRGTWALNAADVHLYNNTYVDNPASFTRTERSATGDHFGWHPATGPDVDEREGHVFVNNLLVASAEYDRPMLQFEQPAALCDTLTRPMATTVDGNVYSRPTTWRSAAKRPLVRLSPATTDSCVAELDTLDEFRALAPGFAAHSRALADTPRSVLRGPDVGNYAPLQPLSGGIDIPAEVRKLLGWTDDAAHAVGAYPPAAP